MRQAGLPLYAKKAFDRVAAATALVATAPIIATAAAAVRLTMGGPAFFTQVRPGLRGVPFRVVKMRTMRDARDADGALLPDSERLTPLGVFLRKTSIDELPQLWNVVRGDLSLVGPRPLLMQYLDRYDPEQSRRHDVLPGITGWAQIHGRNSIRWDEKLALDVWYVDHWSPVLDLRILIGTVAAVVRSSGIAADGHATMPEFQGRGASSNG